MAAATEVAAAAAAATTVATAPGKVLITGGYLVLDRSHCGVVVATSARFKTTVTTASAPPAGSSDGDGTVIVHSPQFGWRQTYTVRLVPAGEDSQAVHVQLQAQYVPALVVRQVRRECLTIGGKAHEHGAVRQGPRRGGQPVRGDNAA